MRNAVSVEDLFHEYANATVYEKGGPYLSRGIAEDDQVLAALVRLDARDHDYFRFFLLFREKLIHRYSADWNVQPRPSMARDSVSLINRMDLIGYRDEELFATLV